jgi:sugar/nucleoside kinase (ribokinase family)
LPRIDIFSPNHVEAGSFFGVSEDESRKPETVEHLAERFLDEGAKRFVVIRCGALGSYALERGGKRPGTWVPAYHLSDEKVVDVCVVSYLMLLPPLQRLTGRET